MVQLRRNEDGSHTWLMEGETLPERLAELATIFKVHAKKGDGLKLDPRFTAELLAMQTEALLRMAEKQEQELRTLRKTAEEFALFKAEVLVELKALKEPETKKLDKPQFKAPPGSNNNNPKP